MIEQIYICIILISILIYLIYLIYKKLNKFNTEYFTSQPSYNKLSIKNNGILSDISKFYVISLDNVIGRKKWDSMKTTILSSRLTKFPAIYGKLVNIEDPKYNMIIKRDWDYGNWKYGRRDIVEMSDSEIGCCLSHYNVWKAVIKDKVDIAMILEDDDIKYNNEFIKYTKNIVKTAPKDWDVILLGFMIPKRFLKDEIKVGDFYKINEFVLTHSYLISNKGAQKLIHTTPINAPIDTWMSLQSSTVNIYRHNYIVSNKRMIRSKLVVQSDLIGKGEIEHTNHAF
jgi:GR25 family glycosyltransferase involved in LPS biosynthesis